MRFLTLLAFVSIALALATKPIQPTKPIQLGTEQGAIDPSLEPIPRDGIENKDPRSVKVVRSDVKAPDGGLVKRLDGIAVPYNVADPQQLLLAGVTVTFIMVGKWVREGGHNVYRYICNGVSFYNPTSTRKVVTLVANGARLLVNQPLSEHRVDGYRGDLGKTVEIIVGNA